MIQANAKCVVNGDKVNEVINALNPLLNMDIIIGDVAKPQIQYGGGSIQIVIPPGGATTNEELDVVDSGNTASTRWFVTTTEQGAGGTGDAIGNPVGKSDASGTTSGRDSLGGGSGVTPNRDQLSTGATSGIPLDRGRHPGGVSVSGTGGTSAGGTFDGTKTDEFGNVIGGGGAGALLDTTGGPMKENSKITWGAGGGGQVDEFGNVIGGDGAGALLDTTGGPMKDNPKITWGDGADGTYDGTGGPMPLDTGDTTGGPMPLDTGGITPSDTGTTDTGGGDFSPGSRDLRQLQIHNAEEFARIAEADKAAMWDDLQQLQSYFNQHGEDLRKYNPAQYQAIVNRMVELSREIEGDKGTR